MNEQRGAAREHVLREIAWRELFPWLVLARSFRLAIHPFFLIVAFAAVVATPLAWRASALMFQIPTIASIQRETLNNGKEFTKADVQTAARVATLTQVPSTELREPGELFNRFNRPVDAFATASPMLHVYRQLTIPLWEIYQPGIGWKRLAFYLFGVLATLAIWGLAGGTITRMSVMELGREEFVGVNKAFRLAVTRWFDFFTAPLYPVLGTVMVALLSMVVGWLLHVNFLVPVAGVMWIFVLVGGAISAFMLLWLFVGWPLMWPAIATEETGDAFDAMSRSLSYLSGKPLNYLFYVVVASLLGLVAWIFVEIFCELVLHTTHWSVAWGCGSERLEAFWSGSGESSQKSAVKFGMAIITFMEGILRTISEAFAFAYFFVSTSAIYLLMRQDVDHTEFDEVWSDEDKTRYPLPPMKTEPTPTPATTSPSSESTSTTLEQPPEMEQNQAE
jgi:hypothetical protein